MHPSFTARHPLTRLDCCPPPCLSTRPLHQSVPPASPRLPSIEDLRSPWPLRPSALSHRMVVLDRHPNTPPPAYLCNYQYKPLALPLLSNRLPQPRATIGNFSFCLAQFRIVVGLDSTSKFHRAASHCAPAEAIAGRETGPHSRGSTTTNSHSKLEPPRSIARLAILRQTCPPSVHALQTSSLSSALPSIKSADTPLLPDAYTYCCCCHGPHELSDTRHGTTAHHEPTAPDIWRIWPGWFTQCSSDTGRPGCTYVSRHPSSHGRHERSQKKKNCEGEKKFPAQSCRAEC